MKATGKNESALNGLMTNMLSIPFEVTRHSYSFLVKTGIIKDSMIECSKFNKSLHQSELVALGPWARQK